MYSRLNRVARLPCGGSRAHADAQLDGAMCARAAAEPLCWKRSGRIGSCSSKSGACLARTALELTVRILVSCFEVERRASVVRNVLMAQRSLLAARRPALCLRDMRHLELKVCARWSGFGCCVCEASWWTDLADSHGLFEAWHQ
jgi:hypothetical protein